MNRQALAEGAIGSLSENADAWPPAEGGRGRISGTFLQAWSNAEHLRVWYQQFLGLRPRLLSERVTIAPRLPEAIDFIQYSQLLAHGRIEGAFTRKAGTRVYAYRFVNMSATVTFDIEQYLDLSVDIVPGMTVTLEAHGDKLHVTAANDHGKQLFDIKQPLDPAKVRRQLLSDSTTTASVCHSADAHRPALALTLLQSAARLLEHRMTATNPLSQDSIWPTIC